jgi:hypothetical protein
MAGKVLRTECGFDRQCPTIKSEGEGTLAVTGYKPGAPHVPENELTIEVPATLIPGVASLDIPDFDGYLAQVRQTPGDIVRIQTLTQYGVPSDQDFFVRYMDGRPGPTEQELLHWGNELAEDHAAGRVYRNIHVVNGPLTDYLRYQFEWAYSFNVRHGMDVRIVDVADIPSVAVLMRIGDFWVLDHQHVVLCRYDEQGRPLGTVGVDASGKHGYIAAAEMAWALATPFTNWWAAHPQYHRASAQAA